MTYKAEQLSALISNITPSFNTRYPVHFLYSLLVLWYMTYQPINFWQDGREVSKGVPHNEFLAAARPRLSRQWFGILLISRKARADTKNPFLSSSISQSAPGRSRLMCVSLPALNRSQIHCLYRLRTSASMVTWVINIDILAP